MHTAVSVFTVSESVLYVILSNTIQYSRKFQNVQMCGKFQALFRPTKCLYQPLTLESLNTEAVNVEIRSKEETGSFPTHLDILELPGTLDRIRLDYLQYRFETIL
jgi:hypothetical protein